MEVLAPESVADGAVPFGGVTGPVLAAVARLAGPAGAVGGRLSSGLAFGEWPPAREPGGRPPPGAVRVGVPPGTRGGTPPGRRESRRPGGRVPGWCCALVMTLCMRFPVRRARLIPGGNFALGILYGARDRCRKDLGVQVGTAGFFTYQGDGGGAGAHDHGGVPGDFRGGKWTPPGLGAGTRKGTPRTYPEAPPDGAAAAPGTRPRKRPDMRVYVPLTLSGLAEAYRTGELGAGPLAAYAVTPALREWYLSEDIEELEYAALNRAALASLRLLAADPGAVRRRVVVAVDVADGAAAVDPDRGLDPAALGEVRVTGTVRLAKAAAVHVDLDDAETDVAAAAEALEAADRGDDDAQFVVDGAEDHELLWYATQEIPSLVELGA